MSKNFDKLLEAFNNKKEKNIQSEIQKGNKGGPIKKSNAPYENTLLSNGMITVNEKKQNLFDKDMTNMAKRSLKRIKDPIEEIRKNDYSINSEELAYNLKEIAKSKFPSINSKYFGFYFLPVNLQNRYLTEDNDVKSAKTKQVKTETEKINQKGELRIDKFDPKGYDKLVKSNEYKKAMEDLEIITYFSLYEELEKYGLKSFENKTINNKSFSVSFSPGLIRNIFDYLHNSEGLPITLRNSTFRNRTIIKTTKTKEGINLNVTKEYKLYDEFKRPYDAVGGFPSSKETGNPYSISDGYKTSNLMNKTFRNETEAVKYVTQKVNEIIKKYGKTEKKGNIKYKTLDRFQGQDGIKKYIENIIKKVENNSKEASRVR